MLESIRRRLARLRRVANKRLVQLQNEYVRGRRVFGQPFHLTLEPGNVCNLGCPLCPTPFREERLPKGMLRAADAARILDRFPYVMRVTLSNWGEPFLNREIFAIIADARRRDIEVEVESNFTLFDDAKAERLVASGLSKLIVALDGASQETYERYRVGGVFADVVANVRRVRRVQEARGDHRTRLEWKFVVNRYNEHELDRARAMAAELGMEFPPGDHLGAGGPEGRVAAEGPRAHGAPQHPGGPQRCHHLWQSVSVNFNGDVFPCCAEFAPSDRLTNVLEGSFDGVWNGPEYRERRARNRGPVDCSRCHGDKETHWYRTWMAPAAQREAGAAAASRKTESG